LVFVLARFFLWAVLLYRNETTTPHERDLRAQEARTRIGVKDRKIQIETREYRNRRRVCQLPERLNLALSSQPENT
jgi:hypothetical protein